MTKVTVEPSRNQRQRETHYVRLAGTIGPPLWFTKTAGGQPRIGTSGVIIFLWLDYGGARLC